MGSEMCIRDSIYSGSRTKDIFIRRLTRVDYPRVDYVVAKYLPGTTEEENNENVPVMMHQHRRARCIIPGIPALPYHFPIYRESSSTPSTRSLPARVLSVVSFFRSEVSHIGVLCIIRYSSIHRPLSELQFVNPF